MGLLKAGKPLRWIDSLPYMEYVKQHGIKQFIIIYNKVKDRTDKELKWGDEIEYLLIEKDHSNKKVYLSLNGKKILDELSKEEEEYNKNIQQNPQASLIDNTTTTGTDCSSTSSGSSISSATDKNALPFAAWRPEYGRFMIEGTPFFPYEGCISCYLKCEESMKKRRELAKQLIPNIINDKNTTIITMSMFPLIGATTEILKQSIKSYENNYLFDILPPNHHDDDEDAHHYTTNGNGANGFNKEQEQDNELLGYNGPIARSLYLPDLVINEHPRFGTLTRNIRERKGRNVSILVPLFKDKFTNLDIGKSIHHLDYVTQQKTTSTTVNNNGFNLNQNLKMYPNIQNIINDQLNLIKKHTTSSNSILLEYGNHQNNESENSDFIHMDAMGFGMGCCCMQHTILARDIHEARFLYDQLAVMCPIMLALTASTPIVKGLLADTDVRWNIVSSSVDDRIKGKEDNISKSRYDSISLYISENIQSKQCSDVRVEIDELSYQTLRENNIDEQLSRHIAHYFIRDPLVIFTDCKEIDDQSESVHFENLQSTNWQTVRFKPPPGPNSTIGWRVEFRVMEVQLTDFENAAFTVFMVLLTRVILSFKLNLMMPLSQVDENMKKAHHRDAVLNQLFKFRTNIDTDPNEEIKDINNCTNLYTIDEIINGCNIEEKKFIGLIPLVRRYLDQMNTEINDRLKLEKYLNLVSLRASGKLMTNAAFIRDFVRNHSSYQLDSIVRHDINYDLIELVEKISTYEIVPEKLLGNLVDDKKL